MNCGNSVVNLLQGKRVIGICKRLNLLFLSQILSATSIFSCNYLHSTLDRYVILYTYLMTRS
jgi:hypothetical protein